MPTATVNGVQLNFLQIEEADGRGREDLVMVHGLATNLAFWYFRYAPEFAKRFRVTLLDLRGHGRSEMPPDGYSPGNLARDLAGLLDHLGIDSAHFVAHSFGGVVTMRLACEQPHRVRSLVLADSHIAALRHLGSQQPWAYGVSIQPVLDRHGLDLDTNDPYFGYKLLTRMAHWQLRGEVVPDDLAALVMPITGKAGLRTAKQWLRLLETTTAATDMMDDDGLGLAELRALRFPTLAIYGENSHARTTGDKLAELWPHATFRIVHDAAHFFPASRPQSLIQACQLFWDEMPAAAQARALGEPGGDSRDDVYLLDGAWYFTTRGEKRIGPFASRGEAREKLAHAGVAVGA